jgi:hypothetical protein
MQSGVDKCSSSSSQHGVHAEVSVVQHEAIGAKAHTAACYAVQKGSKTRCHVRTRHRQYNDWKSTTALQ